MVVFPREGVIFLTKVTADRNGVPARRQNEFVRLEKNEYDVSDFAERTPKLLLTLHYRRNK